MAQCISSRFTRSAAVVGILLFAAFVSGARPAAQSAAKLDGLWDATITSQTATIPFRFEIATKGATATGSFFEGDRKVASSEGTYAGGTLTLVWDHLNTTLTLTAAGDRLTGNYVNRRPNSRPQAVAMKRFTPVTTDAAKVPQTTGTWEMRRVADEIKAPRDTRTWQVFLRQSGAEVAGSILRIDGDTGTLAGRWNGGTLTLSHFAGERPNLFVATPNADRTMNVTLNGNAHYLLVRSSEARAKGIPEPPDPSRYTSVKDPTSPFQFSFPDLSGKMV